MQVRPPGTFAVSLWAGIQAAALVATAAGVRFWPHHPDPPESVALAVLAAVQITAAALLWPVLLPDWTTFWVNLGLTLPMDELAGSLSAAPHRVIWSTAGPIGLWMAGLASWSRYGKSDLGRPVLTCVALLLTLGGTLAWYGRAEWTAQLGAAQPPLRKFAVLAAVVSQTSPTTTSYTAAAWLWSATPLVLTVVAATSVRLSRTAPRLPQSPTDPL